MIGELVDYGFIAISEGDGMAWSSRETDVAALTEDATAALAEALRLSAQQVFEMPGGRWRHVPRGPESMDPPPGFDDMEWYLSGEPAQVLLGVAKRSGPVVLVSSPSVLRFDWSMDFDRLQSAEVVRLDVETDLDAIAVNVQTMAKRRRRSFFWYQGCRTSCAPEDRYEDAVCVSCAQEYLGLVF